MSADCIAPVSVLGDGLEERRRPCLGHCMAMIINDDESELKPELSFQAHIYHPPRASILCVYPFRGIVRVDPIQS